MLSFMAQRIRQTHDIWHVLTGYAPDVPGELALQGFTFAQMRMPSTFLIATVGTAFRAPLEAKNVWEGYERGLKADFLPVVRFEEHWDEELTVLRSRLNIVPLRSRS
jgi:ubiquinone biosynthesis protein COQ4